MLHPAPEERSGVSPRRVVCYTSCSSRNTAGRTRVTALGHLQHDAMALILAPVYANIIHGWSAVLTALTAWRSRGPVR
jgi:hypothetical protein